METLSRYGTPGADGLTQRMINEVFRKARVAGARLPVQRREMALESGSNMVSKLASKFWASELAKDNVTISGSMQGFPDWYFLRDRRMFFFCTLRMELYNNYLVDLLRPIDWQGQALNGFNIRFATNCDQTRVTKSQRGRQNPTLSLRLDKSGGVQAVCCCPMAEN